MTSSPQRTPTSRVPVPAVVRRPLVVALFAVCCALVLAGCRSGTLTDSEQACKSTGGLFGDKKVACTGSVAGVQGQPSLGIIDTGGNLSGNYKLDATITVGKGEAKAYVGKVGGGQAGGRIYPGEPLHISAVVGVEEDDDQVSVNLKVLGKEVKDLRYEATVLPQG